MFMQPFWDATSAYNAWKTFVHQILPRPRKHHDSYTLQIPHTETSEYRSPTPQLPHSANPPHQNFPALGNAPTHRNLLNYQNSPTRYNSSTPQLTHTAKPPHRKSPTPKLSLRENTQHCHPPMPLIFQVTTRPPTLQPIQTATHPKDNPYSVNPT